MMFRFVFCETQTVRTDIGNMGCVQKKSDSRLIKILMNNNIHIYGFKLIYYENKFRNSDGIFLLS